MVHFRPIVRSNPMSIDCRPPDAHTNDPMTGAIIGMRMLAQKLPDPPRRPPQP
jgi:hypothetical protein